VFDDSFIAVEKKVGSAKPLFLVEMRLDEFPTATVRNSTLMIGFVYLTNQNRLNLHGIVVAAPSKETQWWG